jgi:DNA-binding IclR family transcriptional regulator
VAKERSSPERAAEVLAYLRHISVGDEATASIRSIAAELHIGRSTAMRALNVLVEDGHLVVARRGTGFLYDTRFRFVAERAGGRHPCG